MRIAPSCPLATVYLREISSIDDATPHSDSERNRIVLSAGSIDQMPWPSLVTDISNGYCEKNRPSGEMYRTTSLPIESVPFHTADSSKNWPLAKLGNRQIRAIAMPSALRLCRIKNMIPRSYFNEFAHPLPPPQTLTEGGKSRKSIN